VWPGKLLTPKSAPVVLANADHQVRLASPAKMAATAATAKMVTKEAQAKMRPKKKNCCPSHLNANAWPNPARPDPWALREATDHQEMRDVQAEMVNQVHKDHPVHLALLALQVKLALLVQREKMVI